MILIDSLPFDNWLVVLTSLKNISQWEGWHPIEIVENNIAMFETTNQMYIYLEFPRDMLQQWMTSSPWPCVLCGRPRWDELGPWSKCFQISGWLVGDFLLKLHNKTWIKKWLLLLEVGWILKNDRIIVCKPQMCAPVGQFPLLICGETSLGSILKFGCISSRTNREMVGSSLKIKN